MKILDTIFDIIFPVNCLICKKPGKEICLGCFSKIPTAERETANWIFPVFDYRNPIIKKTIWLLKYKHKKKIAQIFAEILHGKIMETISEEEILNNFYDPILIPVPLSKRRYKERGFNQTEIICEKIIKITRENEKKYPSKKSNITFEKGILVKDKETEHQARLKDRKNRLKNLSNTFSVKNEEKIKNKNIILIDDVTTTGATLHEAKKILKQYGAHKIIAFTVAH